MQYRIVPKTGDKISALGFGCMRLPQKNGRIDEKKAQNQIHHAIEIGINYFDTAVPYHMGASEPFLGRALSGGYREKVKIATKLPPWSVKTREDMDIILNSQLKKLQTDHIDYYLIHSIAGESWDRMKNLGVCEFLDSAKKTGRIINAGFSFHGDVSSFKRIVDEYPWEFCQIQYNILDENNQAGTEGLLYAASKNLAVFIMEPLRGGNLAANIPEDIEKIWNESEIKRTPAEWSLRWVLNRPEVTSVLSGMNETEQIDENAKTASEAFSDSLSDDEILLIERVKNAYRKLMKINCTGCRYCMPCPFGVDIPECFSLYNTYFMFGGKLKTKFHYISRLGGMLGDKSYAGMCRNCGRCVKSCPQSLNIPTLLKDVSKNFEGRTFGLKNFILTKGASAQAFFARLKNKKINK
ncbi:MAG: aldo/keto reductase [Methanomicrobium sp.]|nr:aldo/keto reductase [Methanomicrobium sp.]